MILPLLAVRAPNSGPMELVLLLSGGQRAPPELLVLLPCDVSGACDDQAWGGRLQRQRHVRLPERCLCYAPNWANRAARR